MTDIALVIGLDAYADPAWELRAAVRDALRFAKWVTAPGAGRATKETLTLLLSPHPDRPVESEGVEFKQATESAIKKALFDHKKNGAEAQRLWFFYAGHGIAPAGGGPDAAPVIVPADVEDLDVYRSYPIELGSWIREMQVCKPEYQVYFVDACRGIVVSEDTVTATTTLFFDLSKMKNGDQARQAVLFATTAGQFANEQGLHGLFSGALLEGLHGAGPELVPDVINEEFVLTFGGLAAYTKRRIQNQSEEARRGNKTFPTQEPAESLFRTPSTLELARFKEKPCSPVRIFVNPDDAAKAGKAGVRAYNEWKRVWERQLEKAAPLAVPVEWELASTVYKIEVEAPGYENWARKIEVIGPIELHADLVCLRKRQMEAEAEAERAERAGYILRYPHLPSGDGGPADWQLLPEQIQPNGAELATGLRGHLSVQARDRYARIEVFAADGRRVEAVWGWLDKALPVGSYRVEIALPTEPPIVQSVLVTADEPEVIDVRPDPQLTQRLQSGANIIAANEGVSHPSEVFGPSTTTHLGSVLAWAAAAAQFDPYGYGMKLRALGIRPVPEVSGRCYVRVLVGDADADREDGFIESLVHSMDQEDANTEPVKGLEGLAVQWHAPVEFDTSLRVETKGLNPTRFPLPFIADHVWTIVIVRELTGRIEIHRYLHQLRPKKLFDDTIRLVEQGWRALDARTPLYEGEAERLLARDLDPLSLAVLGYRLAREERWPEVGKVVERLGTTSLADAHVLAAFVGGRDENMELAVHSSSVPIVGDGYRALESWLIQHFLRQDMPPPAAPEAFTGGVWTMFDPRGEAVISRAFLASSAPGWATPLLAAAKATARVEPPPSHPSPFIGSGFLIGPHALALTDFIIDMKAAVAVFDGERVAIEEVLGATNDDRHSAVARIVPVEQAPVTLRWALPDVGTRIAVIGHPMITFTPTIVTLAAFTTYPTGEKMIMPGVIVAAEERRLTYECWTMAGVAGGPIVDLATGEVLGIHHSGKYVGGAKKLGYGVPVGAIEPLLKYAMGRTERAAHGQPLPGAH